VVLKLRDISIEDNS